MNHVSQPSLTDHERGSLSMEDKAKRKRGIVRRILPLVVFGSVALAVAAIASGGRVGRATQAGQTRALEPAAAIPAPPVALNEPAPTAELVEPVVDPLEFVSLDLRRQVFVAHDRAEANTRALAESQFPSQDAPADAEGQALYRHARTEREAELRQAARRTLARRFGIEEDGLDAILKQARAENWSLQEIASEEVDPPSPVAKASPDRSRSSRGGGRTRGGSRR
jgi:hypothetical protein